ncbi:MAG: heavy metal translocating P-type ATPase, partial [Mycobacterium leprae]
MAAIPGVTRADLNFGAAKLRIEGEASLGALAEAGKAHGVGVEAESQAPVERSFWQTNPHVIPTVIAFVLAMAGEVAERAAIGPVRLAVLFYAAAILVGGYSTARKGLRNLLRLNFDMNVLMTIAVAGAAAIGQWSEGAVVAFLFGLSETLEGYTMERARQSIRTLMDLAPRIARVRRPGGAVVELPVDEVQVGDLLLVRPGEKIAMDGAILSGCSSINQAAITGESVPVDRGPG